MREKSQETHGAVGPFLFRKGELAQASGILYQLGNEFAHNGILLLLNKKAGPEQPRAVTAALHHFPVPSI